MNIKYQINYYQITQMKLIKEIFVNIDKKKIIPTLTRKL